MFYVLLAYSHVPHSMRIAKGVGLRETPADISVTIPFRWFWSSVMAMVIYDNPVRLLSSDPTDSG